MNRSVVIATVITVGAVAWVLSGQFGPPPGGTGHPQAPGSAAPAPAEVPVQSVRVIRSVARPMVNEVVLQGRTEAWRTVDMRAEVRGRVEAVLVERGQPVRTGDLIARLAVNERKAILDQARALAAQRKIEFEAARTLNQRGHAADVQLAAARAQLDAADAAIRKAEVDLANTEIRAPFDGVLDKRPINVGDFLDVGNPVASVVDLDPLRVVGFATERHVAQLRPGVVGHARIVGGREVEGRIAYVAAQADPLTRTFRVEIEVPNADGAIVSGLTAQIRLPVEQRPAHFVPPSALSLADDGTVGVKAVEADDTVRFLRTEILGTTPEGVWLDGLPPEFRLITVGHEYAASGSRVKPVESNGGSAS